MTPVTELSQQVAEALKAATFPTGFRACGFRIDGDMFFDDDDELRHLVEVVVVLDGDDWDDAVASACQASSAVVAGALRGINLFAMSLCRTQTEHKELAAPEDGLWHMVDVDESCS